MKIVHIIPTIDAEAAGPSYSVPRLCQSVAERGHEVTLSCLASDRVVPRVTVETYTPLLEGTRIAVSFRHILALNHAADHADIIHNHSLWSTVNVAAGFLVPSKRAKLVTSPRGTLSDWALSNGALRKRMFWRLQQRALSGADLLHATSDAECLDIRRRGFNAPVLVLPNGIDLPPLWKRQQTGTTRTLLFLSRIHPIKGLENLIDAWSALELSHQDWILRIVGPGDDVYVSSVKARVARNRSVRVEFVGPLYGADKESAYQNSDLFVLPTHSENFGMAVAEALAHGCPAVVSRGAPWAGLESAGCGWWVRNDVDTLRATLDAAMSLPTVQLRSMGAAGRAWMERDFSWGAVAAAMEAGYRWLLDGGAPPDCVKVD